MTEKTLEIITLLKNHKWISGEEIAKSLHISRTMVWKHIQQLKKKGYQITATPNKGYHLDQSPIMVTTEEIKQELKTSLLGLKIYHLSVVDSTNNYAKILAKNNEKEGTIIIADKQTGGRGRKQRAWVSQKGGLWFSVLFRPSIPPTKAMQVTMCAACAIAEAIEKQTPCSPSIKWPNDILINKKKVCGILTELSAELDSINYLIMGIGLNVNNQLPKSLQSIATSIQEETDSTQPLVPLFISIITCLERFYAALVKNDFSTIRDTWVHYSSTLGEIVNVKTEKEEITGKAIGLAENGELLLRTKHGEKKIITGDITYL